MADVLPTEPAVEARLRDFLAAELRQAELDFPHLPRRDPRGRQFDRRGLVPLVLAGVGLAVLALVVIGPRFIDRGTVGTGAIELGAEAASAPPALPSPSVAQSAAPSPRPSPPSTAAGVLVECGRISPKACATAIDLVRAGHKTEVASATRIVMDDTCPPPAVCDRKYPFDSIVVFVTAGGDTTGWYAFSVVGLVDNTPTTVNAWIGDIPDHVLRVLTEASPSP